MAARSAPVVTEARVATVSAINAMPFEQAMFARYELRPRRRVRSSSESRAARRAARTRSAMSATPRVGIIRGATSDLETMRAAATTLQELGVPFELRVVSAHRTPDLMFQYASEAKSRGIEVIIAGAGGAAHLPGMVATKTNLPVIGVPVESKALHGLDSLLSIAQMPAGVPVGTLAIGKAGAINAGLLAAAILALSDAALATRLDAWRT